MHTFLQTQAPKIVGQIIVLRAGQNRTAAGIASALAVDWSDLVPIVAPLLTASATDGAFAALDQIDEAAMRKSREAKRRHSDWIFPKKEEVIVDEVEKSAMAYGDKRAADMVGMRRDELGRLVPNPNADWQITESTRDMLRADIEKSIEEGWSNDTLSKKIAESYGFSAERAEVIARTETIKASNRGALAGYKASGVVAGKEWLTANDNDVTPECDDNQEAGAIAIDDEFPSGDFAPPAHPNCRCSISPVVEFTAIDNIPDTTEELQS